MFNERLIKLPPDFLTGLYGSKEKSFEASGLYRGLFPKLKSLKAMDLSIPENPFNPEPVIEELKYSSKPNIYTARLLEDTINFSQVHYIPQGAWGGVVDTEERYLATFGASVCFIAAIYNAANRRGALAHLDALSNPEITANLMHSFVSYPKPENDSTYKVVLLAGNDSAANDMALFLKTIRERQGQGESIDLVVGPVFQGTVFNLALDLETGALLDYMPSGSRNDAIWSPTTGEMNLMLRSVTSIGGRRQPAQSHFPKHVQR